MSCRRLLFSGMNDRYVSIVDDESDITMLCLDALQNM